MDELKPGESAYIETVGGSGALRHHLLDMGLTPDAEITLQKVAPMGDPVQFEVRGYELTLRLEEARKVTVKNVHKKDSPLKAAGSRRNDTPHPGVGEFAKYEKLHLKHGIVLEKGAPLTFALAGNQNCGKTTLFNQLTGSNQHVGNFPGVTVDSKEGVMRGAKGCSVVDLPGIYSLRPYTAEEIVTRDFILNQKPDGIINIVDATNIERNLYLTLQLLEMQIPMVLALNMMDEVRGNGGTIDVQKMSDELGIPVVPIAAAKNEGIEDLVESAVRVAHTRTLPKRVDFCDDGPVHRCIHAVSHLIEDHAQAAGMARRFAATKLIEGDEDIISRLLLNQNELEMVEHSIVEMEDEGKLDRNAAIASMRYDYIERLCSKTVVKCRESREHLRSVRIDRVLTNKYAALPIFVGIMLLIFWLTFDVIGAGLQDLLALGISRLSAVVDHGLTSYGMNPVVHSLIIDGIFAGVGSVVSFLPIIVVMFFFLSILEDTGYMARVAFVMDKLLRKIGLSGRSFVPMLIGFGCTVPAVMATRTLPSARDRRLTILLTPFMSCSAKIPIYAVFTAAFFPQHAVLVMALLYFGGMVVGVLISLLLNHTVFRGNPVPFVMELPNYRLPTLKSVAMLLWDKARDFLQRAFTVIFVATLAIWFLESFDLHLNFVTDSSRSLLASIGRILAPVFRPLGFEDWRVTTALITGFTAKEAVVSTLGILTGAGTEHLSAALSGLFTPLSAVSFLTFTLLYTPCVAAIAAIGRELGGRLRGAVVAVFQCVVAWCVAAGLYQLLLLIA
jgi:ferrous iron transport protein B